jgi:hypothetical protein
MSSLLLLASLAISQSSAADLTSVLPSEAQQAFATAISVELFGISPYRDPAKPNFHGHPVLKRVVATADRTRILSALTESMRGAPEPARCFIPRHALRVQTSGRTYDYLLCFECGRMRLLTDGKQTNFVLGRKVPPLFTSLLAR